MCVCVCVCCVCVSLCVCVCVCVELRQLLFFDLRVNCGLYKDLH